MKREIERFLARSDDGEYEVTIIVYQHFAKKGSTVLPGHPEARTLDRLGCNFKDDDTFEILDPLNPGMIVRRIRQD